ncbi:hypothetical protein [Streptomyces sp. NPDC056479]|uniref:hypothetical protein n=1 Tax=unclassified Streptomyces TaxID=2593676 RepID=UPI00367C5D92
MSDEEFTHALDAVLHDLRAQSSVEPRLEEDAEFGLVMYAHDGSGQGIVPPWDATPEERLANLADQVQDWAVETLCSVGAPAVWPHCPEHPDNHPLTATVADGTAIWACPKSGADFGRIGTLEQR